MATIMEALGGKSGQTIMEVLGGKGGQTIAEVITETGLTPVTPEPSPEPEVIKYTVTYNANGGTGTIEPVEVVAGESITVDDGSGLTPPEHETPEFSYEFAGWAKTSSAQSATVVSPFTPDKDTTLYAVWVERSPME